MKILVGYDGSVHADGALYDLARAGLPDRLDAVVLDAVVPWVPYGPGGDPTRGAWTSADMARAKPYTKQALEEGLALADRGARFLRDRFPGWKVKAESAADDPAQALLSKAEAWRADLVVVASHGRSPLGRFLLGSVSHKVLLHAPCGIRLCRPRIARRFARAPLLMLAVDGSAGSTPALDALAGRDWPRGTEVRVVAAVDPRLVPAARRSRRGDSPPTLDWIERKVEAACARLSAAGLRATPALIAGDPRRVLLAEAEESGAQALFLGARGANPSERYDLGAVSAAVAVHAPCTVEVARRRRRG